MEEAVKYHVLPIDDRSIERFDPVIAGRPDLMNGRTKLVLYPGAKGIPENAFINVKNTSLTITAEVEVPAKASGVLILAQGGDFGGWSFYMLDGELSLHLQLGGPGELHHPSTAQPCPPESTPSGVRLRLRGRSRWRRYGARCRWTGRRSATGRIAKTNSNTFGIDESADVGTDENTPVSLAYAKREVFTGKIGSVTVETFPRRNRNLLHRR